MRTARRTDSMPGLVAGAKFVRRLLPGDELYGDALSTAGESLPQHLGRLVAESELQRPSAVRELGLGALQTWQALSESQQRGRGAVDLAILFTDLVGFSSWALEAGDEAALELLRQVGAAEKEAISDNEGTLVKWLGDGAMAVFGDPAQAVSAALDDSAALGRDQRRRTHARSFVPGCTSGDPARSAATTSGSMSTSRRGSARQARPVRCWSPTPSVRRSTKRASRSDASAA